jgi:branched-chain amino acid transport system permease protein
LPDAPVPVPTGVAGLSRIHGWTRWSWPIPALVVIVANAIAVSVLGGADVYTWSLILIYGLFASSYMVAFMRETSVPPLLALLVGLGAGVVLGIPLLILLRRSSGITFAMITLIVAQIIYQLVFTNRRLGGETGLSGITVTSVLGRDLASYTAFSWYVASVVAIAMVVLWRLSESSFGMSLRAVRDDETKAAIIGIPVRRAQAVAFLIAGGIAGLAGALLAQVQTTVSADLLFWTVSGNVVIMCLLGGRYRFWGPFLGAAVFIYVQNAFLQTGALSDLLIGAVFLAIVLVVPDGILGSVSPARINELLRRARTGRGLGTSRTAARPVSPPHRPRPSDPADTTDPAGPGGTAGPSDPTGSAGPGGTAGPSDPTGRIGEGGSGGATAAPGGGGEPARTGSERGPGEGAS